MRTTRRNVLKGGGKAVVSVVALPFLSTMALGAEQDAKLLSRIEAFWAAHKEAVDCSGKWLTEKHRVEALPGCPSFRDGNRFYAFLTDHGVNALAHASHKANKRMGRTVKAVFDIPAKTYQGVLAKLKIVEVAYGTGNEDGDTDLEVYQELEAPWLENAIGDFERLAGRVS